MGSRGLPLVFFPPTFFKESRAPPPESAGDSRRRVHLATVPTEPPTDGRGPGPLSPHFSGEMGTPAGQAGPPGRCAPRAASESPTPRVRSTGLPLAGGPVWDLRRLEPRGGSPPGPGRGIQAFSRESPDAKSRGGMPPAPPFFRARSFPLARFGGLLSRIRSRGCFLRYAKTDLGRIFRKNMLKKHFMKEGPQIRVRRWAAK